MCYILFVNPTPHRGGQFDPPPFFLSGKRTIVDDRTIPPAIIRQMLSCYGRMTKKHCSCIFRVDRGVIFRRELTISCLFGKNDLFISLVINIVQSPS